MDVYTSELFGDVPAPENFTELVELLGRREPDEHFNVRIWRGQADISWPIHSTAYRRLALDEEEVTEKNVRFLEEGLLRRARHKDHHLIEGHGLTDLELLARLRHHGAATRLVDASRNALVALWFAVSDHLDRTGLLLGVHAHFVGGYEGERGRKASYSEVMDGISEYDYPQTWEPPAVSRRVAAQRSQYLYSRVTDAATGSLELPKKDGSCLAIAIAPELKDQCKTTLIETFDIRHVTLFPDLDGFAQAHRHSVSRKEDYRW